jgi:hypothetical protein
MTYNFDVLAAQRIDAACALEGRERWLMRNEAARLFGAAMGYVFSNRLCRVRFPGLYLTIYSIFQLPARPMTAER